LKDIYPNNSTHISSSLKETENIESISQFLPMGLIEDINRDEFDFSIRDKEVEFSTPSNFYPGQDYSNLSTNFNFTPNFSQIANLNIQRGQCRYSSMPTPQSKPKLSSENIRFYVNRKSFSPMQWPMQFQGTMQNLFQSQNFVPPRTSHFNTTKIPPTNKLERPELQKKSQSAIEKTEEIDFTLFLNFEDFLKSIDNELVPILKTNKGSRFFQKYIERLSPKEIDALLHLIEHDIKSIMCDCYGNYCLQKIIKCCNANQRIFLYEKAEEHFLEIACDTSGTHSLQSLIENINSKEEEEILQQSIEKHLMKLSCSSNATHIIQKLILNAEDRERIYLNTFVLDNFVKLSLNGNGICVIKKFIMANHNSEIINQILTIIDNNCVELSLDQYGNYAIQYALEVFKSDMTYGIIKHVLFTNLTQLCCQKFSSNVVEKCIFYLAKFNKDDFQQLLFDMYVDKFITLFKNKYGQFILQNSIMLMTFEQKIKIKENLIKNVTVNGAKDKLKLSNLIKLM